MVSCKTIISIPFLGVQMAVLVSGLDNQSFYGKMFKEGFSFTPKEVHKYRESSLLAEQLTWNMISNGINLFDKKAICDVISKTRFGIDEKKYK